MRLSRLEKNLVIGVVIAAGILVYQAVAWLLTQAAQNLR